MASPLTAGQATFASEFARQTGMDPHVVASWLLNEESGGAAAGYQGRGYNNWLNIAMTDSGPAGGAHGGYWSDPVTAARVSAQWMLGQGPLAKDYGKPAGGITAILSSAGQSPQQQIAAIAGSPWASSHYNGGADLRNVYSQISGVKLPAGSSAPMGSQGGTTTTIPGTAGSTTDLTPPDLTALVQAVSGAGAAAPRQVAAVPDPSFSTALARPGSGLQVPFTQSGQQAAQSSASLSTLLAALNPSLQVKSPGTPAITVGSGSAPSGTVSGVAKGGGGFIPAGQSVRLDRLDQGQDLQTTGGGAIIAPGAGRVLAVNSDPGGFGPNYPIVQFTSGPYAGQTIYVGHTHSVLKPGQQFKQGDVLSHTGFGTNEGNATQPGWAEIGYAPGGVPAPMGAGARIHPYFAGAHAVARSAQDRAAALQAGAAAWGGALAVPPPQGGAGAVSVAHGANVRGSGQSPRLAHAVNHLAGFLGHPLTATVGTNSMDPQHVAGNAVDFPASGPALRQLGRAAMTVYGAHPGSTNVGGGAFEVGHPQLGRVQLAFGTQAHPSALHVGVG